MSLSKQQLVQCITVSMIDSTNCQINNVNYGNCFQCMSARIYCLLCCARIKNCITKRNNDKQYQTQIIKWKTNKKSFWKQTKVNKHKNKNKTKNHFIIGVYTYQTKNKQKKLFQSKLNMHKNKTIVIGMCTNIFLMINIISQIYFTFCYVPYHLLQYKHFQIIK